MSDRVVAKLKFPIDIEGLSKTVKGLEKIYGAGLVVISKGEDWEDGWMVIATPKDAPQ